MDIKFIIFDLGETVLTDDWNVNYHDFLNNLSYYYNISLESMQNAWINLWPKYRIGQMDEKEFWQNFFIITRSKIDDIKPAMKFWRDLQKPKENMLDLILKIKKNYKVSALANISKDWFDYKNDKFKLNDYFDVMVSSGYVGFAKPDLKIYEILIEKLNADPKDCLFIDNSEKCLSPAEKLGMNTILFSNQKELERKLKEYGVDF